MLQGNIKLRLSLSWNETPVRERHNASAETQYFRISCHERRRRARKRALRACLPPICDLRASTWEVRVETSFSLFSSFSIVSAEKQQNSHETPRSQNAPMIQISAVICDWSATKFSTVLCYFLICHLAGYSEILWSYWTDALVYQKSCDFLELFSH